ncbi:gliding motility-associated C-terminal domain-containing protein [Flavobacterium sp. IMCC34518]|uniref:T9SS type B sorting domain-containing protein n=1 Tax=Flavobacterium sp. IMCC34518 TaxID=3003623 RepID=UPI002482BE74|nr:gliding motility-associated C-terminal domain-containing protein [Flavobacterium sp. IMCC34518]
MKNFTLKGNSIIKGSLLIVMFLLFTTKGFSQYSTKHYIAAAPWDYSSRANEFIISCPSGTASVTITKSDGTAITTMSVTSGSPVAFRPTGNPASKPANAINTIYSDRGLIFTSTLPIAVSVRNIESDAVNGGRPTEIKGNASLASYGNEAIGSSFRVGYYRSDFTGLYAYAPTGFPAATAAPVYSVMAIDNNTVVSINGTVLVTLNAGQCYLFQTAIGSLISSTKPVVMNSGQWRDTPTGCGDSVLNEIPPVRVLGTNYLVVRGSGTTRGTSTNLNFPEQTVFIATEDNTRVTVNTVDTAGTITATNNYLLPTAGSYQSIFHGIDGVKYSASIISADKKIIVYSGTAQSCEVDMACVAPISPCTGSYSVETIKFLKYDNTTNLKYFGYVLVNDASAPVFINGVNLETLTSNSRYQIGSSGYYIMRFTNTQLGDPTNLVFTSSVRMSLSMVQSEGGFSMASYLSSYNDNATQQFAPTINGSGCVSALTAEPGLEPYQWYLNDVLIPGATNQTYVPTETGSYSVAGTKECGLSVASTPVVINCIPIDAVNDGSALNPFATVISGTTLATSVKANDFINGVLVTSTNTSITPKTQVPLTINGAGIISVASGTVNGVYPIEYEICSTSLSPNICDKATAYVKVTVFAGSIAADQTICSGGDPVLFSNTASGVGVGTISYRWESSISPFSAWNIISGATSATYDVPIGLTTTTKYRRVAISTLGDSDPTSSVTITVDPLSVGGTVAGGATVCTGTNSTLLTLSGHIGTIIRWESSLDNFATAGTTIALTSTGITVTNLSATTSYRAILKSGTCTATSSIAIVTVKAKPSSNLSGTATICNGSSTNLSIALTGVQPWNLTYSDGTTPTSVTGITTSPYSISVSPTSIKTYSITALSDANCSGTSFTGTPTVTVNALPTTANAGADQIGATTCGLTTVTLGGNTPTVGTGKWTIVSGTGGSFALDTNPTTTFSGTAGTSYTLRWTISNTPCTASSDDVNVIFNILPIAHAVTGGGAYCSGGTGVVVGLANSQLGVNYQLQLGGVNNGVAVAGTGSAISFGNKTAAGTYTVVATNATTSCTANMTGSVVVTINLLPAAPTAPINVEVCETGSSQTLTATATVPSGSSIVWYDASTGGNVVSPATLVSTTAATRTLYGETSNGTCSSLTRTSVTLTILAAPAAQFATTSDITVACGAVTTSTLSYTNNSTTCPISGSVTSTLSAIPSSCGGSVTESWTFTDELGRIISKSRTITVSPAALPTMTALADITVACGAIPAPSTISFSNGLTGGCEISGTSNASTFTATPNSCGGTVTETWTATDTCGRALASVSRTITVSPAALPTMTALADITVACGAIPAPSTISFSNGLTGGCEISGTSNASTFTATPNSCGGTVTETWTATDTCGRALASVSRTITVSPAALPTMTALADITVACGAIPAPSTISFSNGLTGGCEISGTSNASTFTATPNSCGGTVTETWTATDTCGRALASVSRTITVSPAALPTMTALADITVACGAIPAPSTISFSNGLTGGCEISGTSNASTFTATPNSCGGTVTETWTATDTCGRALASVSRTITVSPAALPTMTALADITVACGAIPAPSTISFSNGLTGGCEISGTSNASTFTATPNSCGGTVTETWTATDTCGRALASVSRTITVSPAALPTMTALADITVACGAIPAPSTISFSNGLTGGCEISGTSNASTFTATPNSCGGTVTETWTATDTCGRALASVSRTITVSPAALPTMTALADITVACGAIPAPSTISFSNGLTGGCEISGTSNASTFTATPNSCGGTVTETWTATDTCGRALASVSRTITVSPAALPTMTALADITVACGAIPAPSTISFSNGLTGGCEISGTSNASTFTATPNSCGGTVTETWTATDTCGRALASVSRIITVSPAALPTMTALADITVACGAIPAPSTISFSNGLTGGCEISGTSNASTFTATPNSCGGTVTETWTATDTCGRALASVSRTITVSPAALPTMTALADITVACGAIPAPSTISFSNGLTGGCEISGTSNASTFTATPNSCGGTVTETWTATDTCGRALASVSRTITVSPAALPTMTALADITVACGAIPAPSTISFSNGLTGGCEISGTSNASTFTATPNSCGGTVTETWTATDTCGRALASVSRTITVSPAALPTMTALADITVACGAIPAPSTISFSNGLTGGCEISGTSNASTFTATPNSCGGTVTETWTATDTCGRALASVSRTITVSPAALPTMTALADITVACGAIPAPSTISFSNGLTGGCEISGTSNASTFTATPNSCGGTVTETWTATDTCGRALASVSRTITVSPAALPTMTALADITVACGAIPAPSTISFSNGLTGGCEISGTSNASTFTATPNSCGGTVTETWTATDTCGRALASVSRIITVSPAALPTMTALADITVACGAIPAPSTISFSNGLTGGCEISGTSNASTFTATPNSCGGTVTETWTATDTCGRALASVSRIITVSPAALPTMTALADITVACGAIPAPSTISFSNGLTGGCEISGTSNASTFTTTPNSCGGTVTETWTATDTCGRALASVSRIITVSPAALPTMTALADITVACGAIPAPSTISFSNGLTGGCEISGTSNASTFTATPNSCGGTVTETWTATDNCGRALSSVSRTITVSPAALPTMTALADITVACGAIPAPSTISFSNGLTGGCEISGTSNASTFTTTPNSCGGTVTETWTATDTCGRALASVSRIITVSPAALPTMTALADITVACGAIPAPSTISFSNGLTGGCEISGTSNASTFTATPNSCGGTVTETWTATDNCGRALSSVSRTITVSPAALPTMTALADITVACGAIPAPSTISFSNGLTGGCEISGTSNASTFTATPNSCGGTVTETWTATDTCGRALASVSRTITIQDTTVPIWTTAPNTLNIMLQCNDVNGLTAAQSQAPTATDNCGGTVVYTKTSGSFTAGSCVNSGTYTNTWIAKDVCNNLSATFTQVITVQDTTAPTFVETLPTDVTVECSAVPTAPILTATDNCGTATVTYTETTTAGTCAGSYSLTRTWIAKDLCGLTTTHVQTITVQDTKAPVIISCATNQTVASDSNCQALVPDFTKSIVATDNCTAGDSLIVTQLPAVGSIAMSGNTTIIITIEDSCGNKTTCEANLLVTNFIVANDDIGSPVNGYTGGISFTNVLSNDLLKCNTIKASDVQISFVNATNPGITFANNNVVVAAGTPAGNYTLTYQICEIANLANCDSAIVTIFVSTPIIDAITETTIPINGLPGGTTASLVGNDNLNGYPVVIGTNPGQVTLREVNVPTGLILNLDGTVTVAPSTPAGNYNVTYTICEVTNPTNCDTVTSIVVVGAAVIQAQNDDIVVDNTLNVVVLKPFNEDHGNGEDTLDGIKITFDKVKVTVTDVILPSGQNFPVPKVDLNSNEIVIPPSVPAGIYTIFYTICEKINPSNCSSAVINITVKNPIVIAEDDLLAPIVSKVGATNAGNVLDANPANPDTINGKSLNSNLVIISVVTPAIPIGAGSLVPILDTATGFINVPSNTPAGNYSIIYSICDIVNPTICDQATVIIKVIDVDAVNDSLLPIIGAFGGITESVLMNDNMNGVVFTPATFNTVAVTQVGAYPSGITLNADGTLTVAAGTAIGNYTLQYQICSTTLPSICDIANINLTVNDVPSPAPPVIFAADDLSGSLLSSNSVQEVLNVLDNDAVDLAKATLSNVLISTVTADPTGFMTLKSDGTVEMAAFTPSGTYTMTYSICDKLNLNNCDTAIVTVTVGCGLSTAISGLIKNELTNTPLGNVPVTLKPINTTTGPILLSITKADGSYSFMGMVAGDYVIQVQDANLNTAQELYNTTPSFLILKVEDCKYQKIDFGYNKTDLLVLGDFVWYDLNNNGLQDEWYDANNDGLVTKNIPDSNGVIDFSKWEWIDFNGDGSYKGIANAGELNAAGFGNGTTNVPNIFVTGPNGFSRSVTMGVEGYWRTRAPQGAYGEYKIEFIKEANFEQASEAMSASGLVKVLPSGTLKQARTEKSKSYVDCGLTTNTILYAQFTESVKVNLNLDFGISCKTYADILAVNDDAGTVDGTQALTGVLNVLSNDTINGLPAKASDVSITLTPSPNFTIGTDGLLNVLGNTPGGSYSLNYSICEKANPSNCSQATITIVVERPSIALVKTAKFRDENNDGYAQPGETITYSFEITNTGNTPLSNVTISDPLPGVIMSGSPLTLAIGEVSTTHFSGLYFIKQSDINLGSISNQATVYGTAPSGKVVEDKSDELNLVDDNPTVLSVSGCAIEVFNAVSPDGSAGINDKFYVKGLECYPENSIEIFNRWGVLVFEREHYNNEDRAFKGVSEGRVTIEKSSELPVGTYFYILKYRDSANNAFEKSGYLYLNRK